MVSSLNQQKVLILSGTSGFSLTVVKLVSAEVSITGSGGKLYNASGAIIDNQNLKALVQGLAVELAPQKRVNAVSPTWTETPLWREFSAEQVEQMKQGQAANIPLQRTATIDEVASAYLFLMQNGFITGQTIAVDGGVDLR